MVPTSGTAPPCRAAAASSDGSVISSLSAGIPFCLRTSLASTGDGASIDFDSRDPTLVADRPDPAPYAALWADHGDITLFGAWGPIERGYGPVTRTFDWVASRFSDGALVPRHEVIGYSGDLA